MFLKKAPFVVVVLASTLTAIAAQGDVDNYLIAKGQKFTQNSAGAPQLIPSDNPYRATAIITPTDPSLITSASLKLPNGHITDLGLEDGRFTTDAEFTNKLSLDHNVPSGTYTFTIAVVDDGLKKPALLLGPDAYPSTPHVANWTDAQAIEADQPFTLMWDAFTGGTSNDFVVVQVETQDGFAVFSTPFLFEQNALDGRATSTVIPVNSVDWNNTYNARVLFIKRTLLNTNAYPHALGVAGYYKETHFSISTLPAPTANGRFEFAASAFSCSENSGAVNITITRSGTSGAASVDFTTTDGTAHNGIDYTGILQTVTFADGQSTATTQVYIVDNSVLNSNKTINLHLSNPLGGATIGVRSDAVLTVVENESVAAGTFQFSKVVNSATETGKSVTLTVSRGGGSTGTVSIDFFTSDGNAQSGSDYTATNGTLIFGPGKTSLTITVPVLNDTLSEVSEAFYVYLSNISAPGILGSNSVATVNITSDDHAGSFALSSATYSVSEAVTNLVVKVVRTGGTASDVTIDYATIDGTAVAGTDYSETHGTLTFGVKDTSKTFTIPIINNGNPDGNRKFTVALANPSILGTLGKISQADVTILDDEPSVAFDSATYTVSESSASVIVKVIRTGPINIAASVSYQSVNGSATAGSDYTAANGVLQFAANVASKTITIPITKDTIVEGSENFFVQLFNGAGVELGRFTNATVTITDDDFAGAFNFSAATYSGTEGGNATITVKRSGGTASGVTVQFTMTGGNATSGVDYSNMTQVLTFAANESSKTITVPLIQDITTESTETVNLFLTSPSSGGTIGGQGSAVLSIANKPDPNAVPVSGTTFLKGTIGGVPFTAIASSVVGARSGTAFTLNGAWSSGLFAAVVNPMALGVTTMDNSGNHGVLSFTKGFLSGGHSYAVGNGSDTAGTSGTVTVDGIDIANHRISGRFSFHAREDTGNIPGSFIDIVGSFRENLQ